MNYFNILKEILLKIKNVKLIEYFNSRSVKVGIFTYNLKVI